MPPILAPSHTGQLGTSTRPDLQQGVHVRCRSAQGYCRGTCGEGAEFHVCWQFTVRPQVPAQKGGHIVRLASIETPSKVSVREVYGVVLSEQYL